MFVTGRKMLEIAKKMSVTAVKTKETVVKIAQITDADPYLPYKRKPRIDPGFFIAE